MENNSKDTRSTAAQSAGAPATETPNAETRFGELSKIDRDRADAHATTPERAPHAHRPKRDLSHIQGWGADLDHKNRPGYPMERTPARLDHVHWDVPAQQEQRVEVFHSTERASITPVFGTSSPPKGLSGWIRRAAFKWSENDLRHWLMLLMADRINVVEGIGEDLMQGKVPNLVEELGLKAEMRHNPAGLAKKALIAGAVLGVGYYLFTRDKGNDIDDDDDDDDYYRSEYDPSILSYEEPAPKRRWGRSA